MKQKFIELMNERSHYLSNTHNHYWVTELYAFALYGPRCCSVLLLNPFLIALDRALRTWKVCNKYFWIMGYILVFHLT